MISEEKDEKFIQIFKIFTIIISCIIIGIFCLFFIGISKVDALPELGAFNGSSDVAWWVGYENNNYSCYHNCPSFNRIVIPFYAYTTSTDNKMVFGFNISFRATYQNLYPVVQTANITPYALWSTNNDLWNNWSLLESCSITGTTEQSGDAVITKTWTYQVSCNASPPSNNHFPTIYFNLYNSNGNNNVVLQEFYAIYNAMTFNIVEGVETGVIIDNNNQNSQNIIDSQNQNKDEIIANQNENTDKITDAIEKQNIACEDYNISGNTGKLKNHALWVGNVERSDPSWDISKYIEVNKNKTYTLNVGVQANNPSYCLYDKNKSLISCTAYARTQTFNITPTQDGYIRYSVYHQNTTTFTGEYCYNRIDQTNEGINDINNSLNDSSVDDPSSSFNGLENNFSENSVISDLLLLPVTLYQSVLNSINGTCTPFNLGTLYGHSLTMPCLNISGVIGNAIYGVIDVLISGFFILSIRKKFVDIFESFTSLKVGGNELE